MSAPRQPFLAALLSCLFFAVALAAGVDEIDIFQMSLKPPGVPPLPSGSGSDSMLPAGDSDGNDDSSGSAYGEEATLRCHTPDGDPDHANCTIKLTSYRCLTTPKDLSMLIPCPTSCLINCPVGSYCPIVKTANQPVYTCPGGGFCPGNTSCVLPCPMGFYCPPNASSPVICPPGFFCRLGADSPTPCAQEENCGAAVGRPRPQTILFATLVTVGSLIVFTVAMLAVGRVIHMAHDRFMLRFAFVDAHSNSLRADDLGETRSLLQPKDSSPLSIGSESSMTDDSLLHPALRYAVRDVVFYPGGSTTPALKNVSCCISPGETTAIMGPSGAGKSTLLQLLRGLGNRAGRLEQGKISVSGYDIASPQNTNDDLRKLLSKFVGYVPQDDIMTTDATVLEVLSFQARTRLPPSLVASKRQVEAIISEAMESLRLGAKADCRIGSSERRGLSGGEKKRVNVAMELVAQPSVIFLDEPTSGLDSATSLMLVDALNKIARSDGVDHSASYTKEDPSGGRAVVAVIHQPRYEIFSRFDQIILLGLNKRVVFHGPPSAVIPYFAGYGLHPQPNQNIADFIVDAVSDAANTEVMDRMANDTFDVVTSYIDWSRSADASRIINDDKKSRFPILISGPSDVPEPPSIADLERRRTIGVFAECWVQLKRSFTLTYVHRLPRSLKEFFLPVFGTVSLSLALPHLTYFDLQTQYAFGMLYLGLMVIFCALPEIGPERPVASREFHSGLRISSYLISKDLAGVPKIAIVTLLFSLQHAIISPEISYSNYLITLLGVSYSCYGCGLFISAILPTSSAQLAAVLTSFMFLVFSGFEPTLHTLWDTIPSLMRVMTSLSPYRWAYDLLTSSEFVALSPFWRVCAVKTMWTTGIQPYEGTFHDPLLPWKLGPLFGIGIAVRIMTLVAVMLDHRFRKH